RPFTLWATASEIEQLGQAIVFSEVGDYQGPFVMEAFARLKHPKSIGPMLRSRNINVRGGDVRAIVLQIGPDAEPELLKCITGSADVDHRAAELLGDVGTEKSLPKLKELSTCGIGTLEEAARKSISRIEARINNKLP